MKLSGQTHTCITTKTPPPRGETAPIPIEQEAGWAPDPVSTFRRIDVRHFSVVQPTACQCIRTDYAAAAHLQFK